MAIRNQAPAAFLLLFLLSCRTNNVIVGVGRNDGAAERGADSTEARGGAGGGAGGATGGSGGIGGQGGHTVCKPGECPAVTMAFIPKTSNNPIFTLANQGAQAASGDLSVGYTVSVAYKDPGVLTSGAQAAEVQKAIASNYGGIIVSCANNSLASVIDGAIDQGIAVITFDSDCPGSRRLAYYSINNYEAGATAADYLVTAMGGGPKQVGILTGRDQADNLKKRVEGFNARLATYDLKPVVMRNCDETTESCRSAIEGGILADFPELDGLFITGLWGLQAACACDTVLDCNCTDESRMGTWKRAATTGKHLKTVAFDTLPFQLMLMEAGYLSALISQKYYDWGYKTVTLMFDYLTAGQKPDEFVNPGFEVVCPDNHNEMLAKWKSQDFSAPLTTRCKF
jgi:ribose transport system substrate-binding protein